MHRGGYWQYCGFADGEPPAARRYGGDVWPVEPAPPDHPWRRMPKHAMTPHLSGTTLDAQVRPCSGETRWIAVRILRV